MRRGGALDLRLRRGGALDHRLRRDGLGEFRPHGVALATRQRSAYFGPLS
jgi:hypothetical protein